ncbi:hypothetical protein [Stutzerimonas degradans]|uniref:hypothetical protein n=1 Tax=Stutzerimonas degradans TaxID=2968968 RepID=UPI0013F4F264|nr:hypothetical protein [Stutzerimonas degradans]NHC12152.1 hypothetical protein [Stutzerimonas degradans]
MKLHWSLSAGFEFLVNMVISLSPFIVGILTMMLSAKWSSDFPTAATEVISRGELVIYSTTLMAPIAYAVLRDPPVKYRGLFGLFCVSSILVGGIVYAIGYVDSFSAGIIKFSVWTFLITISVFLSLLLVDHKVKLGSSAPEIHQKESKTLLDAYKRHKGVE